MPIRDNNERLKNIAVLKNGGVLVSVNVDFPFNEDVNEALAMKGAKGALLYAQTNHGHWLNEMAQMIDEGKIKIIISKVYPLEQVADAHRESETWQVRGKLVLEVRKEKQHDSKNSNHQRVPSFKGLAETGSSFDQRDQLFEMYL